jgi:hypothetical protein
MTGVGKSELVKTLVEVLELDADFEEGELEVYYHLYSVICIMSVLHDLEFTETTKKKITFDRTNHQRDELIDFRKH